MTCALLLRASQTDLFASVMGCSRSPETPIVRSLAVLSKGRARGPRVHDFSASRRPRELSKNAPLRAENWKLKKVFCDGFARGKIVRSRAPNISAARDQLRNLQGSHDLRFAI